jgi:hypothetical protein
MVSLVIETVGLSKRFRRKVKPPGLSGSIRALLHPEYREVEAVSGINLQVERREPCLHRAERRREIDHNQDVDWGPPAEQRKSVGAGF